MRVQRTVKVKVNPDDDQAALLHNTIDTFNYCLNRTVELAWQQDYIPTTQKKLDNLTYDTIRTETNEFNGGLVQAARDKALDALKSVISKWRNGKSASKPCFNSQFVKYDKRTAAFNDNSVSLATTNGRVRLKYEYPKDTSGTPFKKYLENDSFETTGAELHYNPSTDVWMLHITNKGDVETDTLDTDATENRAVLGVDLGVNQIAVTSTGRFWSASEYEHWKNEYEKRRASLQSVGSTDAHYNIQAVGRKESGRFTMLLHTIANEIIEEAVEFECRVIAFEKLDNIRERVYDMWGHKWAYEKLYSFVEYKAEEVSLEVVKVDPKNTSRSCSECGFTSESNRSGEEFECGECGYANHADYNAAKNIGLEHLRQVQNEVGGGGLVGVRLNSGVLTRDGAYSPTITS